MIDLDEHFSRFDKARAAVKEKINSGAKIAALKTRNLRYWIGLELETDRHYDWIIAVLFEDGTVVDLNDGCRNNHYIERLEPGEKVVICVYQHIGTNNNPHELEPGHYYSVGEGKNQHFITYDPENESDILTITVLSACCFRIFQAPEPYETAP
ncbi:hypothetical protein RMR21_009640 [Agrobacterium sp. rho-8.1]|nr:hypothetical protein [Agrobacterium sp. rho-8.1]